MNTMTKRLLLAFVFMASLAVVAVMSGCSLFEDDNPTTVEVKGDPGTSCTYDWQCKSNACIYPGICQ